MKKVFFIVCFLLSVWNFTFAQDFNDVYYIKHAVSGKYLIAEPGNPLATGKFVIRDFNSITNHEAAQFTMTNRSYFEIVPGGNIMYYDLRTKSGYSFSVSSGVVFPNSANANEYSVVKLTETGGSQSYYLQIRARTSFYGAPQNKYITPASSAEGASVGVDDLEPTEWILQTAGEISPIPVLISHNPAVDAIDASSTADITLTFSKNINWAASPNVTITNNRTGATIVPTGFTSTGKVLAITHAPLDDYEIYTISIPVGSITNYESDISWSFATGIYNIARGKSTTTSSFLAPGYTGAKVVDGILNVPASDNPSRWITAADGGVQWLEIDLDGQFAIRYLTIYRDGAQGQQKNKEFQVQALVNDNWVPFVSETDYTASIYSKVLEGELPVTNKVRYYVPSYTNNRVRLYEIEIFGYSSTRTGLNDKTAQTAAVSVYSRDNTIFAVSNSSNLIRQISLYNAQGQLIYANDKINAPAYTINQQITVPGVYIVKLVTEQGVKTVKIFNK
jgi:hypothetical protein